MCEAGRRCNVIIAKGLERIPDGSDTEHRNVHVKRVALSEFRSEAACWILGAAGRPSSVDISVGVACWYVSVAFLWVKTFKQSHCFLLAGRYSRLHYGGKEKHDAAGVCPAETACGREAVFHEPTGGL